MPQLKEAKAQGKIAYFRYTKLIIRERNTDRTTERQQSTEAADATGNAWRLGRAESGGGDVARVEGAGAWAGERYETFPTLPVSRDEVSTARHASSASPSPDQVAGTPATQQSESPLPSQRSQESVRNKDSRLRKK